MENQMKLYTREKGQQGYSYVQIRSYGTKCIEV
jgi:hypothetical protein